MSHTEADEDELLFEDPCIYRNMSPERLEAHFEMLFSFLKGNISKSGSPRSENIVEMIRLCLEDGEDISNLRDLSEAYDAQKRLELATKVLKDEKLNRSEKIELYKMLTNKEPPPSKRGAPSQTGRDMLMSLEYLYRQDKGEDPSDIRKFLHVQYKIDEEHALNQALDRGIKKLRQSALQHIANTFLESPKTNSFPNETSEAYINYTICYLFGSKLILKLLERHIK